MRDIQIKNKMTITRGDGEGDNRGKKGKGHQGTCAKDTERVGGGGVLGEREWWRIMETTVPEQQ